MHPYPPQELRQRPPGAPKVFGVLSIIFGSLVTLTSLFGLASSGKPMFMPSNIEGGAMIRAFEEFHQATRTVSLIQGIVMAGMSIALIIIGTGQLKYRRWAAGASVKWGILALLVLVGQAVVNVAIVGPAMEKFMNAMTDAGPVGMPNMGGLMKFSLFSGLVINAVYPILLIVTFRKPKNVEAMTN